jgi:hypothetical protein
MNRNAQYEQRQREKGLSKVTLWIPSNLEAEFRLLSKACIENRDLSFNSLRDNTTGRYVSLERFTGSVTGDGR